VAKRGATVVCIIISSVENESINDERRFCASGDRSFAPGTQVNVSRAQIPSAIGHKTLRERGNVRGSMLGFCVWY
jgi:hypothetical protein